VCQHLANLTRRVQKILIRKSLCEPLRILCALCVPLPTRINHKGILKYKSLGPARTPLSCAPWYCNAKVRKEIAKSRKGKNRKYKTCFHFILLNHIFLKVVEHEAPLSASVVFPIDLERFVSTLKTHCIICGICYQDSPFYRSKSNIFFQKEEFYSL